MPSGRDRQFELAKALYGALEGDMPGQAAFNYAEGILRTEGFVDWRPCPRIPYVMLFSPVLGMDCIWFV